jgi:hypothetical protein
VELPAGANWDVTTKPLLLMVHENHTHENIETDPYLTWQIVWSILESWRRHLIIDKKLHCDFSDWPMLFESL